MNVPLILTIIKMNESYMIRRKYNLPFPALKAGCVALMVLASCQDDFMNSYSPPGGVPSEYISFVIASPDDWGESAPAARSGSENGNGPSAYISDLKDMLTTPDSTKLQMRLTVTESSRPEVGIASDEKGGLSRATAIPEDDELDLGVYAYLMPAIGEEQPAYEGSVSQQFMINTHVDVSDNYSYSPIKYWPGSEYWLQFFSYRPFIDVVNKTGNYLMLSHEENLPRMKYTVPHNAKDQSDLLGTEKMVTGHYGYTVPLIFKHLLSSVQFKVGNMTEGVIKNIALKNVEATGECAVNNNTVMAVSQESETTTFEQDLTEGGTKPGLDAAKNNGQLIGVPFYLIPQKFEDKSAMLSMLVSFPGLRETHEYELERPLNDFTQEWEGNKTYTYSLTTPSEVDVTVTDIVQGNMKSDLHIRNTGVGTVYIRATMIGYWVVDREDGSGQFDIVDKWNADAEGIWDWGTNERKPDETVHWRKGADEYYYYMTPIERNKEIPVPLFKSYTLTASAPTAGAELEMSIAVQAVLVSDVEAIWPSDIISALTNKTP